MFIYLVAFVVILFCIFGLINAETPFRNVRGRGLYLPPLQHPPTLSRTPSKQQIQAVQKEKDKPAMKTSSPNQFVSELTENHEIPSKQYLNKNQAGAQEKVLSKNRMRAMEKGNVDFGKKWKELTPFQRYSLENIIQVRKNPVTEQTEVIESMWTVRLQDDGSQNVTDKENQESVSRPSQPSTQKNTVIPSEKLNSGKMYKVILEESCKESGATRNIEDDNEESTTDGTDKVAERDSATCLIFTDDLASVSSKEVPNEKSNVERTLMEEVLDNVMHEKMLIQKPK